MVSRTGLSESVALVVGVGTGPNLKVVSGCRVNGIG